MTMAMIPTKSPKIHFVFDLDGVIARSDIMVPTKTDGIEQILEEASKIGFVHLCSYNPNPKKILEQFGLSHFFGNEEMIFRRQGI
jgi:hypothetical protein